MSYDAMRWAMSLPLKPAITKFVLVAMAECVNAESGAMECWPSYGYLARRTGASANTVEASVSRLRSKRYIVDTGKREGGTGKVIVFRLNDPTSAVVTPGPQSAKAVIDASAARAQTPPILGPLSAPVIPPNPSGNPPKSEGQSPQKIGVTTPDLGSRTRNGTRKEPGKESGIEAACAALPEVPESLLKDWLPIRKEKRAGPVSHSVAAALRREAAKAGLSPADAVLYCAEVGWQNFNAGFYAKREGVAPSAKQPGKHAGFQNLNYREGVNADGSLA